MIPSSQTLEVTWPKCVAEAFDRYGEDLVEVVSTNLLKPRANLPREIVKEKALEIFSNPVILDRRILGMEASAQMLLEVAAKSQKTVWFMGNLVEIVLALGWKDGVGAVVNLLESGLAYPVFALNQTPTVSPNFLETTEIDLDSPPPVLAKPHKTIKYQNFIHWVSSPGALGHHLFIVPNVLQRMIGREPNLPDISQFPHARAPGRSEDDPVLVDDPEFQTEAPPSSPLFPGIITDGCEWFIRISLLWQKTLKNPLRLTQAGEFFKKDQDRLEDTQLVSPPPDCPVIVPDLGYWIAQMAEVVGVFERVDLEVHARGFPDSWDKGKTGALRALLQGSFDQSPWNPQDGWKPQIQGEPISNPFPSALAIAWAFLGRMKIDAWISSGIIEAWILKNHPWWSGTGLRPSRKKPFLETWLAGIVWPMGLVEMAKGKEGQLLFRLSESGRLVRDGATGDQGTRVVPKMLLIQPNLEIMAFRQGLDPSIIAKLSMFGLWKAFGPACVLQLTPDSVYRALELGESFESVRNFLDGHSTRPVQQSIIEQIGSWASKRERVVIHSSAMVLEFSSGTDLEEALGRGLMAVRLGERHALVDNEETVDFRMFRLSGSRDYRISPEPCIRVGADGLDLIVEESKSDLLLETELPILSDPIPGKNGATSNRFRITPGSMGRIRERGWTLETLDQWFRMRTGEAPKPAVKLFFLAKARKPIEVIPSILFQAEDEETADGLWLWQEFKEVVLERVGPRTITIHPDRVGQAKELLQSLGLKWIGI